jgi:AcrR family transcriptional regulator
MMAEMASVKGPAKVSRRERAVRTRIRIATAAGELFAANGYRATTMEAVAARAGVAVQTVYFVFHTKPQLLVETLKVIGGGAEGGSEVMARAWIQDVVAAPDGARRLALAAEHGTLIYRRIGPIWPAVLAAQDEPEVREAWAAIVRARRDGMRRILELMAARGELRPGLEAGVGAEILAGVHRHELYLAFVEEAGWSFDRYRAWTFVTLCTSLLPDDVAREAGRPGSPAVAGLDLAGSLAELGR